MHVVGYQKNFSLGTNEKERLYIFVGREVRLCQVEFIPSRSLLMCKSVSASFGKKDGAAFYLFIEMPI